MCKTGQPSLTSSAVSADLPWPRNGQDSEQSPSARSTNTARKCLPKTSTQLWPTPHTGMCHHGGTALPATLRRVEKGKQIGLDGAVLLDRHYTQTSSISTEQPIEAVTSSQVDFLASLSALPGSDEARQMTVRSGRKCSELLRKHDPLGCLARTFLESSRWNSTTCFLTWRESATPAGRLLFRLVPSMPGTDETDCGSSEDGGMFLTPNVMDYLDPRSEEALLRQRENNRPGRTTHSTLREQVAYPPPKEMFANNMKGGVALPTRVKSPRVEKSETTQFWPTPQTDDRSNVYPKENRRAGLVSKVNQVTGNTSDTQLGSLNPTWVEWLMGYPLGWTDLKDSETQSSHRSPMKSCEKSGS